MPVRLSDIPEETKPIRLSDIPETDTKPIPVRLSDIPEKKGIRRFIFQPISRQLTGQTITERLGTAGRREKEMSEFATKRASEGKPTSVGELMLRGAPSVAVETLIDLVDMSPADIAATIALPGVGKLIGKIPFKGTTIGEVVKTIPVGKGFVKKAEELGRYEQTLKRTTPLSSRGIPGKPAEEVFLPKGRVSIQKEYSIEEIDKINSDIKNLSKMLPALRKRALTEDVLEVENKLRRLLDIQKVIFRKAQEARQIPTVEQLVERRLPKEAGGVISTEPSIQPATASTTEAITQDPIQKITQALREAKPIRGEQEKLYTIERTKRAARIAGIGQQIPGEAGYRAQLGALKGALPKVQFEGIRNKIGQVDIDSVFSIVEQNEKLLPFEKITAKSGLAKLLGAEGGAVPTENELKLLGEIFPQNFIQTVLNKRPLLAKLSEGVGQVLNIPRSLMASIDFSAPLRQGLFLIGRPKQFLPAFRDMFKYAFNEKAYQGLLTDIQKRPTYPLMRESKLSIMDLGSSLTGREEKFMSNLAEKIPGIGRLVRGSGRAYTGFLNKLRADVFDDLVTKFQSQGIKIEGKALNDLSNFIGTFTGRGKLGALEGSAVALNSVFFAPRLMASRLNILNPLYYTKLAPPVRKEALKSLFATGSIAGTVLTLAKLNGAEVGIDPRSADFGKIKLGNTRYDILGGTQQYIRAAAQLITGEHISSTTGVKTTMGEGYKPLTRLEIASRFLETKEAPIASFVTALLKGQDALGKKLDIPKEVTDRFTPMVIQDMKDLYKERGLEGIGMGIPAFFGTGVQTYSPDASEMVYSANSVLQHSKELLKQGNVEEAQKLIIRNQGLIKMGKTLEPQQKIINTIEKLKTNINKNITLSSQEKKSKTAFLDQRLKELQQNINISFKTLKEKQP